MLAAQRLSLDLEGDDVIASTDVAQDVFALSSFHRFLIRRRRVGAELALLELDDLQAAIGAEPLGIFGYRFPPVFLFQFSDCDDAYVHAACPRCLQFIDIADLITHGHLDL